ncbi:MAG: YrdB family protein [Gordonia sp. (in: high G+C Gram-positive bacteria)]|uniref:YrdB family protein n=1 Tax=Gordonia sp. (in: high G+C Gram-positive bacteria) TaxID=84139 RepID=UPI0039E52A74
MNDVNANDVLAFFVELAALVLLGVWGWHVGADGSWTRPLLAVLFVAVAIGLWALFAAPKARIQDPTLTLLTKVAVLGASVVAAFVVLGNPGLAGVWAALVAVNLILTYRGPYARG